MADNGVDEEQKTGGKMQTFSPDNPIRVEFTFRDQSGVDHITAIYRQANRTGAISMTGNGNGETEATVELTSTQNVVPGEYQLDVLEAHNARGFHRSYGPNDVSEDKRRFQNTKMILTTSTKD